MNRLPSQEGDVFVFSGSAEIESANDLGEALHLALPGVTWLAFGGDPEQIERVALTAEQWESSWLGWAHA
ncbi:hypothetical protein [Pseudomonas luteola]|uniref:hypothetical protein n=1 Tax=Pseudomonas luteola TaxID=47886 RepID=UPI00123B24FA|nr:hypothetical protein [Pseudomonas luteola]QEU31451.1 hypothetical protein FOB45_27170 [Pseudomonas luteola]QEU31538.1 hypothetical protein FOB45_27680 [Pseudomonas luteola]